MMKKQQPNLLMLTEIRSKKGASEFRFQRATLYPLCFMHLDSFNFIYGLIFFNISVLAPQGHSHYVKFKQV